VEKAKATRARRKEELAQLGNMGMGEVAVSETEPQTEEEPPRSRRRRQSESSEPVAP
jgi:hypothetical protein